MGFKISWICFGGIAKDRVLEKVGLRDTQEVDEANEAPFSGADLPGGWFILFANDFEFATPKRLASVSADCRVVACKVHEGVMVSGAFAFERGASLWQVVHDSQTGPDDLSVSGSPPPQFESIRRRLMQQQDVQDEKEEFPVDYVFDIPVETAAHMCGYRHDRSRFDWGEPQFTRLEAIKRRRSWSLGRLFGSE